MLNLNYRSNQTIVEASNEVIRKNKFIVDKDLQAFNKKASKLNIYAADEAGIDDVEYLVKRVKELAKKGLESSEMLVLYRRSKMFEPYGRALHREGLSVTAKTIHAAKGLEARAVFIIGLLQGYGGFPDIWYNDAIYQVIRREKFHLMLEEERRLFYAALTRAREEINLITLRGSESQFIDEIPLRYFTVPAVQAVSLAQCPGCGVQLQPGVNFCSHCGQKIA
ncbi:MAG: zinc-ribbon domain-containing protein [Bacteroidales bacterium]|nr:zinc-ribbon domain-containing protein [Bacteroidales bacterium]